MKKVSIIIPYINSDVEILETVIKQIFFLTANTVLDCVVVAVCNSPSIEKNEINNENVIFLHESHELNSPYSARNTGIECIKSDYYVFLDATCMPSENWWVCLEKQVNFGFDLIAANVNYFTPHHRSKTIGDCYDSIVNIDNEYSVKSRRVAKTACLAVNANVLNDVGMFEPKVRSGGDVFWTKKATNAGFSLKFCKEWLVEKESRSTASLIKKQFRVAKGWPLIWRHDGMLVKNFILKVCLCFLPPNPLSLFGTAKRREIKLSASDKISLVFFGVLLRITSALGVLVGLFKKTN